MGDPVVHFEVVGKDGEKLREFFANLFGWQYQLHQDTDYGIVQGDEGGIGGGVGSVPAGSPGHLTWYVGVDDLQAKCDQAKELGGEVIMEPMDIPGEGM